MAARKTYVSQAEFARRLGVTRQYVGKLVRNGVLTKCKNGKLDLSAAVDALKTAQDPAYSTKIDPAKLGKTTAPAPGAKRTRRPAAKGAAKATKKGAKKPAKKGAETAPLRVSQPSQPFAKSKAEKEYWNAKRAKLDFQRAEGEMLDAQEVSKAIIEGLRPLREKLTAAPAYLAGELVGLDAAEMAHKMDVLMREVLTDATESIAKLLRDS